MNIVAKIEGENYHPVDKVLFSVNQHEENNNNYSLWIGLPKIKGDGKYDYDHVTCLDVCLGTFWEGHLQQNIKRYLEYVNEYNDQVLENWKEELKLVQGGLDGCIYVKKKLMEVLVEVK